MEEWNEEKKKDGEAKTNAGIKEPSVIITYVHSSHMCNM